MAIIPQDLVKFSSLRSNKFMFVFWHKKKDEKIAMAAPKISAPVIVIPDVFYGGADPVIHFTSEAPNKSGIVSAVPKAKQVSVVKKSINKKLFLIAGGAGFLFLFLAITALYYFNVKNQSASRQLPIQNATQPANVEQIKITAPTSTPPKEETASSTEEFVPTSTARGFLDRLGLFPPLILIDTADMDSDSLTDAEEELFGTDSGVWDTDTDGYYDGQEVVNLYNPKGFAPIRIIDSGLVKEYVNPDWQYRIYYPAGWEEARVGENSDQVIFSDASGDFVEARVFKKQANESFQDWFARTVEQQSFTDLIQMSNRFHIDGWKRKDNLAAYFESSSLVYVLIYHPSVEDAIAFRHVMVMMRESFRPEKTAVDIPNQPIVPQG